MRMIPYFLTTLLTLAPTPASANRCENYRTILGVVCPNGTCENPALDDYRDRFQTAKTAWLAWANDNSPHCKGHALCLDPVQEYPTVGRYTWRMYCFMTRIYKAKRRTGIPAPPTGLERVEDKGHCDANCKPAAGFLFWSGQRCGFSKGPPKGYWDIC
ncbi:hypothetical protein FKW77_003526 [Venturia effusa]|uniref:Secreted protein n=1 Tax=Venturia effusa TaxID=50376 RepID=A0A517L731_9PEZI|nr:hypothetical protein FKW77_003526 [Venturia effusa]